MKPYNETLISLIYEEVALPLYKVEESADTVYDPFDNVIELLELTN